MADELLLQPSLQGDARMEALARLTARLSALPAAVPIVNLFDLVDPSALASLGEQFHVLGLEGWNAAATDVARRDLLKRAIELHRHKGTAWAVRHALETAFSLPVEIVEWFDYGGEPYFFRVRVDVSGAAFGPQNGQHALELILEWKNVRSWLEYLETFSTHRLPVYAGLGGVSRTAMSSRICFPVPEPVSCPVHTALACTGLTGSSVHPVGPAPAAPALPVRTALCCTGLIGSSVHPVGPAPAAPALPVRTAFCCAGLSRSSVHPTGIAPRAPRLRKSLALVCTGITRSSVSPMQHTSAPSPLRSRPALTVQSFTRSSICPIN